MEKVFQLFLPPKSRPSFSLNEEGAQKATDKVNWHNGRKNIYRTVYNFVCENDEEDAIIDKIFLDFDPDEEGNGGFEDAKKVSGKLTDLGIKHANFFSGRGAHVYVYTQIVRGSELNAPSIAIRNFADKLFEDLDVVPDTKVIGDLNRVSRLPNTLNMKTKLFCIPVCEGMMNCSEEQIRSVAKKQRYYDPVIDGDLVDLRKYDNGVRNAVMRAASIKEGSGKNFNWLKVPACVQKSLESGTPGYQERFLAIVALRELAYSKEEVISILEKFLTHDKFIHCVEEEQQVDYLFSRDDIMFPSCMTVQSQGYCVEGCVGQDIYYRGV